MTEIWTI